MEAATHDPRDLRTTPPWKAEVKTGVTHSGGGHVERRTDGGRSRPLACHCGLRSLMSRVEEWPGASRYHGYGYCRHCRHCTTKRRFGVMYVTPE
ncbi:hypothetical protein E2C01_068535 [Portunus trituberculatus]|uniref:Uncharacterized protein n=1 Tax=Portunus trituberculatus TaxID=210409 RepID=A0A5B7HWD5_PORTR|nr:hypothetical protein [Portunus trituberculatus]